MIESAQPPLLKLTGVSKRYGATVALDKIELTVNKGTIHAILGENGAGKSTLMKSMVGVVSPDEGHIELEGTRVAILDPHAAAEMGIVCVFQELSLIPDLTVAENITLAAPPLTRLGTIDLRKSRQIASDLFSSMGVEGIHPDTPCNALPMTKQQLVEIAKALHLKPRLLILDEATSALSADDVERLFNLLYRLRDQGTAILFISHRMHEIDEIADTCSVFRNGSHIETFKVGTRTDDERVQMMIGRSLQQVYPLKPEPASSSGTPRLETRDISWEDRLQGISLRIIPDEICGLGGLEGQGQNDFLLALFGVLKQVKGKTFLDGNRFSPSGPRTARDGLALVPESRKTEGLHLEMSVADNLTLASLDSLSKRLMLSSAQERKLVNDLIEEFEIKTETPDVPVGALSGGNQQKVLLAKWIARSPRLLLLNDPTRGVDVGTKQQIYALLRKLADKGMSILLYSTDYDELIGLCDRVHVFYGGRDVAQLEGDDLNEQSLMRAAMLEAIPPKLEQLPVSKGTHTAKGEAQKNILIPSGCVQNQLDAGIDNAAVNLLTHLGVNVTLPDSDGCCGAMTLHLGKTDIALDQARRNVDAWHPMIAGGLDAIVITTTGCGTTIKDYGHLLRADPDYSERATEVASLAMDITEFLSTLKLPKPQIKPKITVAYHAACSLQHAQQVTNPPRKLLLKAGFKQVRPENEQQCCGSAGTYSILQSDISTQLRDRKVKALEATGASVITAGNIGCLQHIGIGTDIPIVHIVKLLNWAFTGEKPSELAHVPDPV